MLTRIQRKFKSRGWTQVVALLGGVTAFSKILGLPRTTVSTWLNDVDGRIPLECCILASFLTGIVLEHLSPETEDANKIIRNAQKASHGCVIEMLVKRILISQTGVCTPNNTEGRIIVGGDKVLISGHAQFEDAISSGLEKISVVVIDVDALIAEVQTLDQMNDSLSQDQKNSIYQRMKEVSPGSFDHQGHFKKNSAIAFKVVEEKPNDCLMMDKANSDPLKAFLETQDFEGENILDGVGEIVQDGVQSLMEALGQEKRSNLSANLGKLPLIERTALFVQIFQSLLAESPHKPSLIMNGSAFKTVTCL